MYDQKPPTSHPDLCEAELREQIEILHHYQAKHEALDLEFIRRHARMVIQLAEEIAFLHRPAR